MKKPRADTFYYGTTIITSFGHLIFTAVWRSFLEAWALMVLLGMVAGYASTPGLAIGYWACFGVSTLWGLAKGQTLTVRTEK